MANIKSPAEILEAAGNALETAVDKAGDGVEALAGKASETKERIDKARFGPVFDLDQINDNMPQIIYVEDNQRLKNIPACKGAIGFTEKLRGVSMMRLLPKYIGLPGISFYPDPDGLLYVRDPYDDHLYIDINAYFDYLKLARVNEIEIAAQDLGARHITIACKEEEKTIVASHAEVPHSHGENGFCNIEVMADVEFSTDTGVVRPELKYLKDDPTINSLIRRRLDGNQIIHNETCSIVCSSLGGLHCDDAVKIDGLIKALKLTGNTSVSSQAEAAERSILEYTITF